MAPPSHAQIHAQHQRRVHEIHDKVRTLPAPHPAPQRSSWTSTLRQSLCCTGGDPPSPDPTDTAHPERRHNHFVPSWPSSLDDWVQTSDVARQDVFDQLRAMMGEVNAGVQLQQPTRPVDEAISELYSHGTLKSTRSVSELGAEGEPAWLAGAGDAHLWTRQDSLRGVVESVEAPCVRAREEAAREEDIGVQFTPVRDGFTVRPKVVVRPVKRMVEPSAQRRAQQVLTMPGFAPAFTAQEQAGEQGEQEGEEAIYTPTRRPRKQPQPAFHLASQPMIPSPPLTALIYFTLERPRGACTTGRGTYLRHFSYPMRLPLSTAPQLLASIAHLRAYLTEQPARFLSHFHTASTATTPPDIDTNSRQRPLLVNLPSLFASAPASAVAEKIWGAELRWAWVDASEARFAEAVVGVLRHAAERRVARGMGGVVDLVCVVREVVDGRRGYGLLMDVRRTVRGEPQRRAAAWVRVGVGRGNRRMVIH